MHEATGDPAVFGVARWRWFAIVAESMRGGEAGHVQHGPVTPKPVANL